MVTINDIAKKAGVAKSTVSRYLNNGSVSQKTREKIEKIIKETGYTPNTYARSLKAEKTNMIGVIIPRLNSASTNEVLEGIDATALAAGYQLVITNSNQENARELENIRTLQRQKVAGIIMLTREITSEHVKLINELRVPFLSIGQKVDSVHSIIHQDYTAGQKIAEYALDLGHKDFLYIGVPEYDQAVGVERKNGFLDTLKKRDDVQVKVIETEFSRNIAYEKALTLLPKMTASYVACATDNIAVAFLKAANELGYSVPAGFSLSGFGGYDTTSFVTPTITTVSYPYQKLGKEAVGTIQQLINDEAVPFLTELPNTLTIKQSTKQTKES